MTLRQRAPAPLRLIYRWLRLRREAARLMRASAGVGEPSRWLDALERFPSFLAIQKRGEITGLLETMRRARPATVCEIGSALGGTSFLLARAAAPGATVVYVDQAFDAARKAALRRFAGPGQTVRCLQGSSTDPRIRAALQDAFGGRPLDFLFIDGDHHYEGVSADFAIYSPLVRRGGLIAFHDIVLDHGQRFGKPTGNWAGGVPRFWEELKGRYPGGATEFIEDPGQDGYGIGLLDWPESSTTSNPASRQ